MKRIAVIFLVVLLVFLSVGTSYAENAFTPILTGTFLSWYLKNCIYYKIDIPDDYEFGLVEGSFLDKDMTVAFDSHGIKTIMYYVGDIGNNDSKVYKVFAFLSAIYQSREPSIPKDELFTKINALLTALIDADGESVPIVDGYKGFFEKLATQSIIIMQDLGD